MVLNHVLAANIPIPSAFILRLEGDSKVQGTQLL